MTEETNNTEITPQTSEPVETAPAENVSDAEQVWRDMEAREKAEEVTENTPVEEVEAKAVDEVKEVKEEAKPEPVEDYKAKYEELSKQLETKEVEKKAKVEEEVKKSGFESLEHKQAHDEVILFEFNKIADELANLPAEMLPNAYELLNKYTVTGSAEDLRKVKALLSPDVLESIAIEKRDLINAKNAELKEKSIKQDFEAIKTKLVDFAGKNKEWLAGTQARSNAVASVVESLGTGADLDKIKTLIDMVESDAIKAYQESLKKDERKDMLKSPQSSNIKVEGDKWFTKAQISRMSDREYLANSAKIQKQMLLEKDGTLPKQII